MAAFLSHNHPSIFLQGFDDLSEGQTRNFTHTVSSTISAPEGNI